jgi:hypothetical protein
MLMEEDNLNKISSFNFSKDKTKIRSIMKMNIEECLTIFPQSRNVMLLDLAI